MARNFIANLLKAKRKELNLSVKDVLQQLEQYEIKVSDKTLYGWESGHRQPDADTFLVLCSIYGVDTLAGIQKLPAPSDNVPSMSDEAIKMAKDYDILDRWGQEQIRTIVKLELKRCLEQTKGRESMEAAGELIYFPLSLSMQPVSAGKGAYLGPEEMETIFVQQNDLTEQASFAVKVAGNSMEPLYSDGDILLVEGADDIRIGEIGVFTMDGDGYVKKRGEGELISLNPEYAPIPMNESIWCNGRVIGKLAPEWIQ